MDLCERLELNEYLAGLVRRIERLEAMGERRARGAKGARGAKRFTLSKGVSPEPKRTAAQSGRSKRSKRK